MNQQNINYKVLGIMSGTSFDGIDLCISKFRQVNSEWHYDILSTKTISYDASWKQKILAIESASGEKLSQLHVEYGHFLGSIAKRFLDAEQQKIDLIASHGHTIFHQTENGFTFQLGHGAAIAATSGVKTVSDFRSLDVALGGQGAPLVPFGDKVLFSNFDCCINIGGIANISFENNNKRVAFDIAPANMVLNYLYTQEYSGEFDTGGKKGKQGSFNPTLFNQLNSLDFYSQRPPKSLGKEWVFKELIPTIDAFKIPIDDKLNTFSKHLSHQIQSVLLESKLTKASTLITGGGAKNTFLMELLREKLKNIKEVNDELIDFKEALIFAFLGLMRHLNQNNTLKSVTGARKDSCGGNVFFP